ncbi:DEAD/DEAH box helicase [Rhizoctonia solani]|uniref:RNA helicase n=1 Tax=Rhizoctonia solani TaxID=456999 RepID=A0A8H8P8X9_9AGAM|nr:DEAD/DEAH box helicase [Rhizoctonia solani]QRW26973.1 DEAD/DEAH box helicase [Rhizoctonia solani]
MSRTPLSIESLVEKQKAEQEAASKPKFLTREERAKLAIERRAAEIRTLSRPKDVEMRDGRYDREKDRDRIETGTGTEGISMEVDVNDERNRKRDDRRPAFQNGIPTGPRAERDKDKGAPPPPPPKSGTPPPPPPPSDAPFVPPISDTDLSAIRSRYLGVDKKKRKIRKMNDRKFVFDWDEQEDTGSTQQSSAVMFGRGHLAGMEDGGGERMADAKERRAAARHGADERHWSDKPLNEMKERDWRIFREDFSIACGNIPFPLRSWTESEIPQAILDVISAIGYEEPSPIQRQAIPIGLQNRDVIGIAETGSGKTASFVIPMLVYIQSLPALDDVNRHLGPYALILAPTRELAQQIEAETRKFATPLGYKCVSIVGGRAVEEQQFNLREGAEIIIATPGRLKDVIDRHVLVLSQCTYVVMDEADRMVHLGFEADLTFILDALPAESLKVEDEMDLDGRHGVVRDSSGQKGKTRVTTLFSATMPPAVERLARKYLRRPAVITIGEAGRAVESVEQRVEFVIGDDKKKARLLDILNNGGFQPPIIVFVNQKKTADMVAKDLSRAGWSTSTLHSGKNQEQREAALQALRTGEADVLVATDLAGRGIDVQDVSLVINYQMANTIEAYVHRIGSVPESDDLISNLVHVREAHGLGLHDAVWVRDTQEIKRYPKTEPNERLTRSQSTMTRKDTSHSNFRLADLVTIMNGFCGSFSIFSSARFLISHDESELYAALAFPLAASSRWRQSSSLLGQELDSLADLISFGVAPALLAFTIGFRTLLDQIVLTVFICCGLARLARFNATVASVPKDATGKSKYFEGLPIPSSLTLVGLMTYWLWGKPGGNGEVHTAAVVFGCWAAAMVSKTLHVPKP